MACKGICIHYKASSRYATGRKRCQTCDLFMQWDGVFCPCCGSRLGIGPRNIEDKANTHICEPDKALSFKQSQAMNRSINSDMPNPVAFLMQSCLLLCRET